MQGEKTDDTVLAAVTALADLEIAQE